MQTDTHGNNQRVYDIKGIKNKLGTEAAENLLVCHAMSGCDTTSRLRGVGKPAGVSSSLIDGIFKDACKTVMTPRSKHQEIAVAGEKALLRIYEGKSNEKTLNDVRVRQFTMRVASAIAFVQAERLPPTLAAAKYHFYRCYLQIMKWQDTSDWRKPEEWGWHLSSSRNMYLPIMTDASPAPENLLKMVRCQCSSGCEWFRCNYRRNGLPWSFACGEYKGALCANTAARQDEDDNEDEQEEELALGCALKSKCSCD